MKLVKELGECYAEKDGYKLFKDELGYVIYSCWTNDDLFGDGQEYGVFRGYLAHLENFSLIVEDLKIEDALALEELRREFS